MKGKRHGLLLMVLLMALMCSCAAPATWTVPQAKIMGGYTLTTDNLECWVMADGTQKYSRFHSMADDRTVELYASSTELILIQSMDGIIQYHRETFQDQGQNFPNPLERVFDSLRTLEFTLEEQQVDVDLYKAVRTEAFTEAQQVNYIMYALKMTWTDGQEYLFRYYDYADGATLISAEAPNEINPLLTADTAWRIDLEKQWVINTQTGEKVNFTVINQEQGLGLSPNGGEGAVKQRQVNIYAYVNGDTAQLERLRYENGVDLCMVYEVEIAKPEITSDMIPMDHETAQFSMMLAMAIEDLV